jgi:hypothetical protein
MAATQVSLLNKVRVGQPPVEILPTRQVTEAPSLPKLVQQESPV